MTKQRNTTLDQLKVCLAEIEYKLYLYQQARDELEQAIEVLAPHYNHSKNLPVSTELILPGCRRSRYGGKSILQGILETLYAATKPLTLKDVVVGVNILCTRQRAPRDISDRLVHEIKQPEPRIQGNKETGFQLTAQGRTFIENAQIEHAQAAIKKC